METMPAAVFFVPWFALVKIFIPSPELLRPFFDFPDITLCFLHDICTFHVRVQSYAFLSLLKRDVYIIYDFFIFLWVKPFYILVPLEPCFLFLHVMTGI